MRSGSIALILMLALGGMASAATLERGWPERARTQFDVDTEVFVLYDGDDEPQLRDFRPCPSSPVTFRLPAHPEESCPLHYGEVDRVSVFVICSATQDPAKPNAEGQGGLDLTNLAYGVNLVFVVPDGSLVPHRWIPKTSGLNNAGRDLRDMLVARRLIPDEEAEVFAKRGTKPFTYEELTALFQRIEAGEVAHAVDLEAKAGRKKGYMMPSSIDATSLQISVDDGLNVRVRFDDPGIAEAGDATEYLWTCKGFFLWSKKIEGRWSADGSTSSQDFTIEGPDLNPDGVYTLSIAIRKPGTGDIPVRSVETQFRFSAGTGTENGDDPFGYEGLENR